MGRVARAQGSRFLLATCYSLLATLFACGYHLAGGGGSALSPDARTIAIPTFRNQTFEPNLESVVTRYVKNEFLTSRRLKVVQDAGRADLLLNGTIVKFDLIPLSFDLTRNVVQEYRIKILAEVSLEDSRSRKVLWKDAAVETTAEFLVSLDTSATRVAQDRAIAEASRNLAEDLVSRVLEGS